MGSCKEFDRNNGGFHHQEYTSYESIAGIKIIEKKPEYKKRLSDDPPSHSDKSEAYFAKDEKTGRVHSLKIYEDRTQSMEFHTHHAGENPEGTVHYHVYHRNSDGSVKRDDRERALTPELIQKYGGLIQRAHERNVEKGLGGDPPHYDFKEKEPKRKGKKNG